MDRAMASNGSTSTQVTSEGIPTAGIAELALSPNGIGPVEPTRPNGPVWLHRIVDTMLGIALCFAFLELAGTEARSIFPANGPMLLLFGAVWHGLFSVAGLYDAERPMSGRTEFIRIAGATSLMGGLLLLALLPQAASALPAISAFWLAAPAATFALRSAVYASARVRRQRLTRAILIVGNGPRGRRVFRDIQFSRDSHERVIGFLDNPDRPLPKPIADMTLGPLDRLEQLLIEGGVDEVVITLPIKSHYSEVRNAIHTCERVGVDCRYLADLFDGLRASPRYGTVRPHPMVTMKVVPDDYRVYVKRAIDIMASSIGLVVLLPLLTFIATAIKLTSRGPVLFVQDRYGFMRRRFPMLKFRSMVENAPALQESLESQNEASGPVFKIRNDPRVTPLGRILRSTSLDELPQLVNVLLGDMSLVGPRPLPMRDVGRFSEAALLRRFSVKPGITGLWQVSGRSDLDFDEWMNLDLKYIDEWSFGLELKILLKTIPAVLSRRGAL